VNISTGVDDKERWVLPGLELRLLTRKYYSRLPHTAVQSCHTAGRLFTSRNIQPIAELQLQGHGAHSSLVKSLTMETTFIRPSQRFLSMHENNSIRNIIIIIIIIIIITGTTALCEPWPSSGFMNNLIFYGVRLSASRPTTNLENQGIPLSLAPTPRPVRPGWPYQ
jgi:hypothetical protein